MHAHSDRRLIVEGQADQSFFEALCRDHGITKLWIGPPTTFSQGGNGKGNALQALEDALDDIRTGHVTNLGIVVDADFVSAGASNGIVATRTRIDAIVGKLDYSIVSGSSAANGLIYSSRRKGLPQIGAWIMPDNRSDGYLEHFCLASAAPSEATLVAEAKRSVAALSAKRFLPHKTVKAEVSTWLAWQQEPGQGLNALIGGKLLDATQASYASLTSWLRILFLKAAP